MGATEDNNNTLNAVLVAAVLFATLGYTSWTVSSAGSGHSVTASLSFFSAIIAIWICLCTFVFQNERVNVVITVSRWALAGSLALGCSIVTGTLAFLLQESNELELSVPAGFTFACMFVCAVTVVITRCSTWDTIVLHKTEASKFARKAALYLQLAQKLQPRQGQEDSLKQKISQIRHAAAQADSFASRLTIMDVHQHHLSWHTETVPAKGTATTRADEAEKAVKAAFNFLILAEEMAVDTYVGLSMQPRCPKLQAALDVLNRSNELLAKKDLADAMAEIAPLGGGVGGGPHVGGGVDSQCLHLGQVHEILMKVSERLAA